MRNGIINGGDFMSNVVQSKIISVRMTIIEKKKKKKTPKGTTSVGENVEKRDHSCTVGGNAKRYSHCGKQYGGSSES